MAGEPPRRPGRASLRHFRASPVPLFPTNCIGACPGCASSPLRRFACRELLEFYRGPETHRRGPLLPVIEDVPIPKGLSPALLARLEHVIQQQFPLQWPEEALLSSLGETVSFFAYARQHAPRFRGVRAGPARISALPLSLRWISQGGGCRRSRVMFSARSGRSPTSPSPTDQSTTGRVSSPAARKGEPALSCGRVRHARDPHRTG